MSDRRAMNPFEQRLALLRAALASQRREAAQLPDSDALELFITAQMNGEDVVQRFPDIAAQLDGSVEAAFVYAGLYGLLEADDADALPVPTAMPKPDLSFLQASPSLAERLQQAVEWVGDKVRIHFSAELLPFLQPPPALAPVRGLAEDQRYSEALFTFTTQQSADVPHPVTVTAFKDAVKPELCMLQIVVEPVGSAWPFDGIAVTAISSESTLTELTDVWGTATFADVAVVRLGELTLEIDLTADE